MEGGGIREGVGRHADGTGRSSIPSVDRRRYCSAATWNVQCDDDGRIALAFKSTALPRRRDWLCPVTAVWATGHASIGSTARAGRTLRLLGYDVSARGDRPWLPSPRDRLEIDAFRRDVSRAIDHPIAGAWLVSAGVRSLRTGGPLLSADLDALTAAASSPAMWSLGAAHRIQCCAECHFSWEEREIFPYLPIRERDRIRAEHVALLASPEDPAALRSHSMRERKAMVESGVPARLLAALDADHRSLIHG